MTVNFLTCSKKEVEFLESTVTWPYRPISEIAVLHEQSSQLLLSCKRDADACPWWRRLFIKTPCYGTLLLTYFARIMVLLAGRPHTKDVPLFAFRACLHVLTIFLSLLTTISLPTLVTLDVARIDLGSSLPGGISEIRVRHSFCERCNEMTLLTFFSLVFGTFTDILYRNNSLIRVGLTAYTETWLSQKVVMSLSRVERAVAMLVRSRLIPLWIPIELRCSLWILHKYVPPIDHSNPAPKSIAHEKSGCALRRYILTGARLLQYIINPLPQR